MPNGVHVILFVTYARKCAVAAIALEWKMVDGSHMLIARLLSVELLRTCVALDEVIIIVNMLVPVISIVEPLIADVARGHLNSGSRKDL